MWFFLSVLMLWGMTAVLGRQEDWFLPPFLIWGLWTACQYSCALLSFQGGYKAFYTAIATGFGFTLVLIYYSTQAAIYMEFLPKDAANPNLWPDLFLYLNLVIPLFMMLIGCLSHAVQKE